MSASSKLNDSSKTSCPACGHILPIDDPSLPSKEVVLSVESKTPINQEDLALHKAAFLGSLMDCELIMKCPKEHDINARDQFGNTPLMIATQLGHRQVINFLLSKGALIRLRNREDWTPITEAISYGDRDILKQIYSTYKKRSKLEFEVGIVGLVSKLKSLPDFSLDLHWKFWSWVPLISRFLPSDTIRITKFGASFRLDFTLIDIYKRGNLTYIITPILPKSHTQIDQSNNPSSQDNTNNNNNNNDHDVSAHPVEIYALDNMSMTYSVVPDEMEKVIIAERARVKGVTEKEIRESIHLEELEGELDEMMALPISRVKTAGPITFEPAKTGIWPFRKDKIENVYSYSCRVYNMKNMVMNNTKRKEHMSEEDIQKFEKIQTLMKSPLESLGLNGKKKSSVLQPTSSKPAEEEANTNNNDPDQEDDNNNLNEVEEGWEGDDKDSFDNMNEINKINEETATAVTSESASGEAMTESEKEKALSASAFREQNEKLVSELKSLANPNNEHRKSIEPPQNIPQVPFDRYFENNEIIPPPSLKLEANASSTWTPPKPNYNYLHIGRTMKSSLDVKKHSASVYMSKDFPLELSTIISILDVIGPRHKHVQRLKNFLNNKLPEGFPVSVQIPVAPTIKAQVTFANYKDVLLNKDDEEFMKSFNTAYFTVPSNYTKTLEIEDTGSSTQLDESALQQEPQPTTISNQEQDQPSSTQTTVNSSDS